MEHSEMGRAPEGGEHKLTECELGFLRRGLDSEVLGLKKCMHYAEVVGDENARQLLQEHADIHHRRIDLMLGLLSAPGNVTKQAKLLLQTGKGEGGDMHA